MRQVGHQARAARRAHNCHAERRLLVCCRRGSGALFPAFWLRAVSGTRKTPHPAARSPHRIQSRACPAGGAGVRAGDGDQPGVLPVASQGLRHRVRHARGPAAADLRGGVLRGVPSAVARLSSPAPLSASSPAPHFCQTAPANYRICSPEHPCPAAHAHAPAIATFIAPKCAPNASKGTLFLLELPRWLINPEWRCAFQGSAARAWCQRWLEIESAIGTMRSAST